MMDPCPSRIFFGSIVPYNICLPGPTHWYKVLTAKHLLVLIQLNAISISHHKRHGLAGSQSDCFGGVSTVSYFSANWRACRTKISKER